MTPQTNAPTSEGGGQRSVGVAPLRTHQAESERAGPGEVDPAPPAGRALVRHPGVQESGEQSDGPLEIGHHVADADEGGRGTGPDPSARTRRPVG